MKQPGRERIAHGKNKMKYRSEYLAYSVPRSGKRKPPSPLFSEKQSRKKNIRCYQSRIRYSRQSANPTNQPASFLDNIARSANFY